MQCRSGLQQRRNSFEDGVAGTTCPIPPGANFTYILQAKDQIGTYFYFPSLAFHKAAGGFGGIRVLSRPRIPVPFPPPAADYTVLIGDWYKTNHTDLRYMLDSGKALGFPDGLLINGRGWNGYTFTVQPGKYMSQQSEREFSFPMTCWSSDRTSLKLVACRHDVPLPDHQRRAGHVPQHQVPGAHHEAGGGGGLAHHADRLLLPGRAPWPVLLGAPHGRPAWLRLLHRRLHALHHQDHIHHRRPALRQLRRQGSRPAAGRPHHPDRLVAQPGPLYQMEPDGERAEAQPAGLVPLRPGAHHQDHQAGQLGGHHQRQAEVRGEQRVARQRRHTPQDRRLLQDPRRVLGGHHL
uniref:Plastocyanin-like domain-containing protein n=1 Tax=Aegilops tauschii subsp. strangulata TaxID=200361 RepID=A0A453BEV2_AEGTS